MSDSSRTAAQAAQRIGGGAARAVKAWRKLSHERRLAAGAALGLFLTLFLPWYQDTVILSGTGRAANLRLTSASITGWGAFSFAEAAVLLVAAGVLTLLFMRAEGRAFHIPGGDGGVITAAGVWTSLLIVWRIFDKSGGQSNHGLYLTSTGIEWGIFIALGVAGFLAYAGSRIRVAHEPEPPLPGETPAGARGAGAVAVADPTKRRARTPPPVAAGQPWPEVVELEDAGVHARRRGPVPADEAPTRRAPADEAPTRRVSADNSPTLWAPADEAPTRRVSADEAPTLWAPADEARTRQAPPDEAPTGHATRPPDEAPMRQVRADEAPTRQAPTDDAPTRSMRPAGDASRRPRPESKHAPDSKFEFPDIEEIDFEDPPSARLGRSARPRRRPPASDDEPKTPIDQRWDRD